MKNFICRTSLVCANWFRERSDKGPSSKRSDHTWPKVERQSTQIRSSTQTLAPAHLEFQLPSTQPATALATALATRVLTPAISVSYMVMSWL